MTRAARGCRESLFLLTGPHAPVTEAPFLDLLLFSVRHTIFIRQVFHPYL